MNRKPRILNKLIHILLKRCRSDRFGKMCISSFFFYLKKSISTRYREVSLPAEGSLPMLRALRARATSMPRGIRWKTVALCSDSRFTSSRFTSTSSRLHAWQKPDVGGQQNGYWIFVVVYLFYKKIAY